MKMLLDANDLETRLRALRDTLASLQGHKKASRECQFNAMQIDECAAELLKSIHILASTAACQEDNK